MNLDAYLARIGLDHRPPPTLAGLTAVHRAHLLAVPYENLDVQLGRPVTIERPAIYEKIVNRRRGGWCYEMNGILGWALGQLGFLFCFKHQPGGTVLLLRGRVLRTITPAGVADRVLEGAEDLVATLKDGFTLDIPEAATLWPKICKRHEEVMAAAAV